MRWRVPAATECAGDEASFQGGDLPPKQSTISGVAPRGPHRQKLETVDVAPRSRSSVCVCGEELVQPAKLAIL
jgi:hypothetical protein